jgi:hypothetical protein
MHRNFGMSRPIGIEGASTADRALSRAGAARDPISEYVTAAFVGCFVAFPFVAVWFLAALVDWEGVGDLFYSLCNFG